MGVSVKRRPGSRRSRSNCTLTRRRRLRAGYLGCGVSGPRRGRSIAQERPRARRTARLMRRPAPRGPGVVGASAVTSRSQVDACRGPPRRGSAGAAKTTDYACARRRGPQRADQRSSPRRAQREHPLAPHLRRATARGRWRPPCRASSSASRRYIDIASPVRARASRAPRCAARPGRARDQRRSRPARSSASRSTPSASVRSPARARASPSFRLKARTARTGSSRLAPEDLAPLEIEAAAQAA